MLETALASSAGGRHREPAVAVADAQYWNERHMDHVTADHGIQVLIPPDSGKREGERPGWTGGRYSFMRRVLATDHGKEIYADDKVDRTGLRSHQTQPQDLPVQLPRQIISQNRMAVGDADPQPHKAPPPPNSHRPGLTEARPPGPNRDGHPVPANIQTRCILQLVC